MFDRAPTYDRYRTLRYVPERLQRGEDVWALQIALAYYTGENLEFDGIFGPRTHEVTKDAQEGLALVADAKAGGLTQRALTLHIANQVTTVPFNLIKGQIEHESSYRLGIYSAVRQDGSYDAGVTQRNTNFTPAKEGFQPVRSIKALTDHVRSRFDLYSGILDDRRRWGLAAGAWNAPAFANYYAGVKPWAQPSDAAAEAFLAYVDSVTAYI